MDKEFSVTSYSIQLSVIEYKTLVLREDWETAEQVFLILYLDNNCKIVSN